MLFNTDMISGVVQIKNTELKKKIIDKFGKDYYIGNAINKEFAKDLFYSGTDESSENLKWITKTVGTYVAEYLRTYKESLNVSDTKSYILVESAILFETGFEKECDYVIGVKSTNPINAAYQRDYTTREEWEIRMATQLPENKKKFDFVIGNDYTDAVQLQVNQVHTEIMNKIS